MIDNQLPVFGVTTIAKLGPRGESEDMEEGKVVNEADHAASAENRSVSEEAICLVHRLVKSADWIRRLVSRMEKSIDPSDESIGRCLSRDLETVCDLSGEICEEMHLFLDSAASGGSTRLPQASIEEVIRCAMSTVRKTDTQARISWLPDSDVGELEVPGLLSEVVVVLLQNAIMACSGSSVNLVEISAWREGGILNLSIEDGGVGMRSEVLAECQKLGFSTRRARGGHGVGLHAASTLVRSLGGELVLASEFGRGTRALIKLEC
jgi:signal transduction histidine kinase